MSPTLATSLFLNGSLTSWTNPKKNQWLENQKIINL